MKVFEALARAFHDEGSRNVFSLMGDANMMWLTAMADLEGTSHFFARNEAGAVAMADGYARASRDVGVCSVTCGPGLTQIGTSLVAAVRYSCPMVVFAGDTPRGDTGGVQFLDQARFAEACGAKVVSIRTAGGALEAVRRAFSHARMFQTPVVLNVPIDVQEEEISNYDYEPSTATSTTAQRIVPDPDRIDQAAGLLALAQRPIFIVGRGALVADAESAIERLASRVGALTATTMLAKGALAASEYMIGIAGEFANDLTTELFSRADLVFAIGASLNQFTTLGGHLFSHARVIQLSDDPSASIDAVTSVTCSLVGDAKRTVEMLDELLEAGSHQAEGFRSDSTRDEIAAAETHARASGSVAPGSGRLDPREVATALENTIAKDALIVQGAGHFWSFPIARLTGGESRRFIFTNGFGAVGQALPIAIGASVGSGGRPVVVIEGDTSLMMNVQEIDTAARYGLQLTVVVMNDAAVGAEYQKLKVRGVCADSALIASPSFDVVARSFGAHGAKASTLEELNDAMAEASSSPKPTVIDVLISHDVVAMGGITIPSYAESKNSA